MHSLKGVRQDATRLPGHQRTPASLATRAALTRARARPDLLAPKRAGGANHPASEAGVQAGLTNSGTSYRPRFSVAGRESGRMTLLAAGSPARRRRAIPRLRGW